MEEMMFSISGHRTLSVGGRRSFRRWAAVVAGAMLVSLLLRGPAPAQQAATCTPPPPASAFDPARPNLGQLKLTLLYYQC
jgi:hypothetical protein